MEEKVGLLNSLTAVVARAYCVRLTASAACIFACAR